MKRASPSPSFPPPLTSPSPEDSSEVSTHILYLKELKPNEMKSPTKSPEKKQICERRIRTRCRAWRAFERLSSPNLIGRNHPNKSRLSRTAELSSVLPGRDTFGTAWQSNRSTGRLCNSHWRSRTWRQRRRHVQELEPISQHHCSLRDEFFQYS